MSGTIEGWKVRRVEVEITEHGALKCLNFDIGERRQEKLAGEIFLQRGS